MDTKLPTTPNVDELIVAIQALRPVRNQAEEEFARIYPAIKERLAKGVTQKAIREALAMKGFRAIAYADVVDLGKKWFTFSGL